jgi:DNA segregation ATPase FtsK/SpoIIIE-like protein
MSTRQERSRRLALRVVDAMSIAAVLALLNGCIVQERVYGPPPEDYSPPPREYTPPPIEYPPSSQEYPQAAPSYEYAEPQMEVRTTEPPPPLPYYEQPQCPEPGYLWTPGYWAYGSEAYFWVPGTWVMPPQVGVLWTPGYWGWGGGVFLFHAGYWGPHVGFYGGVNYGGGYTGEGFEGGRWEHDHFRYNTAVNNINTTIIHNTYNQTVINNITVNKVSYNGGAGGIPAAPSHQDQLAARERHIPPPMPQMRHINEAGRNPELQARFNQGRPPIAATPRPGAFTAPNIVRARGATIPTATAPGASRAAEPGYRPALEAHPGNYREQTPYRDATPTQSPQAATTRAPTDTPQQPPRLRPEFAQPQQRPQAQPPSAQYQQRPQPQPPSAQYQQRPQAQPPSAQYQQRPQPQPPSAQPQQRPQPQPPPAQPQQRPQPQAPHPPAPAAHPQTPHDDGKRDGNR